jgi:hypothetical protein
LKIDERYVMLRAYHSPFFIIMGVYDTPVFSPLQIIIPVDFVNNSRNEMSTPMVSFIVVDVGNGPS